MKRWGDALGILIILLLLTVFILSIAQSMRAAQYECEGEGGRWFWFGGCSTIEEKR